MIWPRTSTRDSEAWPALRPDRPAARRFRLLRLLFVVPLLAGLMVGGPAGPVAGDELEDAREQQALVQAQIAAQQAAIAHLAALQDELRLEIAATKEQLSAINADITAVRASITELEGQIAVAQAEIDDLVSHLAVLDTITEGLDRQAARKEAELRTTKAQLADRIRAAYESDRTTLLETMLSGASFTDVLVEASYQVDIADSNRELAETITEQQATLAAIHQNVSDTRQHTDALRVITADRKDRLDADRVELEEAKAELEQLEQETEAALTEQEDNFAAINASKADLERSITLSAEAQKRLEARIAKLLKDRQAQGKIPSIYNGTLAWPLAGRVTQNFGCTGFGWEPPRGSCPHFHSGIDIAAPMYTPITASGPGTVLFAGPNPYDPPPKAWIVIIAHSGDLLTWYAHLDNAVKPPAVRAGQQVRTGDVIGYVGMTGRTTGPHLHWMVEFRNDFVNPRLFL